MTGGPHALVSEMPNPAGDVTITGDWYFNRETLRIGTVTKLALGLGAVSSYAGLSVGTNAGLGLSGAAQDGVFIGPLSGRNHGAVHQCTGIGKSSLDRNTGARSSAIGESTGLLNSGSNLIAVGYRAGMQQSGQQLISIGSGAGRNNTRDDRLIIHTESDGSSNLTDPLIDGRFRDGTDSDAFAYSKGVKINGILETTGPLVRQSPDGTRWEITVDDTGALSTAAIAEAITP